MPPREAVYVPIEPLLHAVQAREFVSSVDDIDGGEISCGPKSKIHMAGENLKVMVFSNGRVQPRSWHRWKVRGQIPLYHADALATGLGYHPWELWGDAWFEFS